MQQAPRHSPGSTVNRLIRRLIRKTEAPSPRRLGGGWGWNCTRWGKGHQLYWDTCMYTHVTEYHTPWVRWTLMIREIKKHREKARPLATAPTFLRASGQHKFTSKGTGQRPVHNLASKIFTSQHPPAVLKGSWACDSPVVPERGPGEPSHADFLYHALGDVDFVRLHSDGCRLATHVLVVLPVLQEGHTLCYQEPSPRFREACTWAPGLGWWSTGAAAA